MADEPTSTQRTAPQRAPLPSGPLLRGTQVAPGLALGVVHRKDYDLFDVPPRRVPLDQIERELNRFHAALKESRAQLEDLKQRLRGKVPPDHVRILDTHITYLRDTVFLSDVENLILNEQMSLEAAIAKVVSDFDRIFRLVENELLRDRAVDLRDVGIRVLRNLEQQSGGAGGVTLPPRDYVLVARELSIVDMFNLDNEHVLGIVTEAGGLTSHAAILARSMRIPTLTGVAGLLGEVREGDFVILDAADGALRVEPDEVVRAQYREARAQPASGLAQAAGEWAGDEIETADGVALDLTASCGNLPEVEQAAACGVRRVGLYRTELLYLIGKEPPSLDALVAHYTAVAEEACDTPVTFRLLDADSSLGLGYLHAEPEANPALGRAGVRVLLEREQVLRQQLQAILRAAGPGATTRIAVPFVVDCGELRRVKELLFDERFLLAKRGAWHEARIEIGAVIQTPAAALGAAELSSEADFLVLSLDSLVQYLMAADRQNLALESFFDPLHPVVLRAVRGLVEACKQAAKPLSVLGVSALSANNLPFLIGAGLRGFCVAPVALAEFVARARRIDAAAATRVFQKAARASCRAEILPLIEGARAAPE